MASSNPPQNPSSQNLPPPPKLREEGELTSSDDDALPALSDAPSTSIPAPSSRAVPNVSAQSYVQGSNPGKQSPANMPARSAEKNCQTPGYTKGFNKNKVLLKPSNPGWQAPAANANLVIRFSDDDSGSDEERRKPPAETTKRHPLMMNTNQRPPALPHVKLDTVRRTAKNEANKVALTRTFISSMTKAHGSNVKSTGQFAQRRSWTKNSNMTGRSLPSQDGGVSKHVGPSSSDYENLRQRIIMRENELKLKVVPKNKENISESCRDVGIIGQSKVASKKSRTVSTDVQTDSEEPDTKRLKLAQYSYGLSSSKSHQNEFSVHVPQDANIPGHAHQKTKITDKELLPRPIEMQIEDGKQLPLSDCVSRPMEALVMPMHTALTNVSFANHPDKLQHTGLLNKDRSLKFVPNSDTCVNNLNKVNDHHVAMSMREKLKSKSDSSLQPNSLQVSGSKSGSPKASPDSTSILHSLGRQKVQGCDVDSFFQAEELHDKELEEAQEHRRRCEVEEINALKAYRRAQRALAEANACCTHLYHKRELYSAQLRSYLMEDSSLLLTPRKHRQIDGQWNLSYNVSAANLELMPTSSHQLHADCETGNQLGYGSNAQSADGEHNRLYENEDGNNLGSEACSEHDASTSELVVRGNRPSVNDVCSPSNDPNLSPDDDDGTFPLGHRSVPGTVSWPREDQKDMNVDSSRSLAVDSSHDPLALEAYLRSKLFSRLKVTDSLKRDDINYDCKIAAGVADEHVASGKSQTVIDKVPFSDPKGTSADSGESYREPEGSISEPTLNKETKQPTEMHTLDETHTLAFDSDDAMFHSKDIASKSIISSSSIFRSAMNAWQSKLNEVRVIEHHHDSSGTCIDYDILTGQSEDKSSLEKENFHEQAVKYVSFGKVDSYILKDAIDPFKPLCMYELRGRCNNDECPWQHLKEDSSIIENECDNSDGADCPPGSSSNFQKQQKGCIESYGVLIPPKYLVCFDGLKADTYTDGSLACHIGTSRKNIFSNSLALSSSLIKHLPSDEPYLHGSDGCVDSFVGGVHSLYFQNRNFPVSLLQNGFTDNDQALEIALLGLNQEANRLTGMKKALSILSRSLETSPASFHLWIVYLLLYYSSKNSIGEPSKRLPVEDDLFSLAVKHNSQSYELWLLYINSRGQLNDRVVAYERALSSLCHHASTNDGHGVHDSAIILDLFLQLLYCFCISGNIWKALQRIQGLILTDRDPDESHSLLLSDILECLTISDKCIFWVCCVYLVIYRKLPDALVRRFEFEKDISDIEWPSVRLTLAEKQQVLKLMEMALDSIGLRLDRDSNETSNPKSAYLIALNHIKLMSAIDGEESCKMLLEKYKNSYPLSLELTLLSARTYGRDDESKIFEGFKEAICNWPKDVPGIQFIWNQFAEYALENGGLDRTKEIMDKWFHSVWKPLFNDGSIDFASDDPLLGSYLDVLPSNFGKMDIVFGLLNLSLFRLFQNDVVSAQLAIDKALRTADTEVLRHCIRDHAAFQFKNRSLLKKINSLHGLLDIIKGYTIHAQAITFPCQLTTKFIQDIKKPRLRQLLSNILCPTSPNSSLVNLVLHTWFGPSLLPQNTEDLKFLVDFVESILAISPGSYEVAISICRLILKDPNASIFSSASVFFWASSLLVNTIYNAIPVPPEFVWVEGADLLSKLTNEPKILESFHQRALSVYPFSINLWKSFLNLSTTPSKRDSVIEAARDKGIDLD